MSNKFLGLDSINVLVDYIDKEIANRDNASKLVTIFAYKYVANGDAFPEIPVDGGFDFNGVTIVYPNGWSSLKSLLESIGDNSAIEAALTVGSIYMSTGVELSNEINWSYPVKILGNNDNRLNSIDYTTTDKNLTIYNFDKTNYFISNSSSDTHYVLNNDFISGYTGKFANIGTGNMIITTEESTLIGIDIDNLSQISLYPGETAEIITYNDNGNCLFISLGKNSK